MYVTQGFLARVNISKVNIIGIELTRYHQRGRGERRGLTIVGWATTANTTPTAFKANMTEGFPS